MNEIHHKSSSEIDGNFLVIAATNRLEDLDEAVIRRFESKIYVGVPSMQDRKQLITTLSAGVDTRLATTDIDTIASRTDGWSGSDIEVSHAVSI